MSITIATATALAMTFVGLGNPRTCKYFCSGGICLSSDIVEYDIVLYMCSSVSQIEEGRPSRATELMCQVVECDRPPLTIELGTAFELPDLRSLMLVRGSEVWSFAETPGSKVVYGYVMIRIVSDISDVISTDGNHRRFSGTSWRLSFLVQQT
jgi:hypothetical protein